MRRVAPLFTFFLFMLLFAPKGVHAQDTSAVITKTQRNFKQEIVIDYKRYRVWDNYTLFGVGTCLMTNNPYWQLAFGIDFNFHIKQMYFNAGGMVSGREYGLWNNRNGHIGYIPIRRQTEKYSYAIALDVSYSDQDKYVAPPDLYILNAYQQVGFYGELQLDKKIDYSTGYGITFFTDLTPKVQIFGLRIDGYLSGGYRGYVPGHQKPHM